MPVPSEPDPTLGTLNFFQTDARLEGYEAGGAASLLSQRRLAFPANDTRMDYGVPSLADQRSRSKGMLPRGKADALDRPGSRRGARDASRARAA